ncbi:MAG: DUF551 domain-containing protein [Anaerolineales bacterium]|nr:DUF551 domain-containing protein [Anaerolineales bacterium]
MSKKYHIYSFDDLPVGVTFCDFHRFGGQIYPDFDMLSVKILPTDVDNFTEANPKPSVTQFNAVWLYDYGEEDDRLTYVQPDHLVVATDNKQIKQAPRWIPITEALPEPGKEVLAVSDFGQDCRNTFIAHLGDDGNWSPFRRVMYWREMPAEPAFPFGKPNDKIEVRIKEWGDFRNWKDITPSEIGFSGETDEQINLSVASVMQLYTRGDDARWNYKGSLQGHYVRGRLLVEEGE